MTFDIIQIIEYIGIISFAISGAVVAIDKEMDFVGVVILSVITSFGGGIMRDLIIGRTPLFFTDMALPICIALLTAILVFVFARVNAEWYIRNEERVMRINNYIDALGLGAFAVSGVKMCIVGYSEKGAFMAIMMGVLTAVGGGVIRDVCLRDIPFILRKRIYAAAALAGASVYYLFACVILSGVSAGQVASAVMGLSVVLVIRVLATVFKLNFPKAIVFSEHSDRGRKESNQHIEIK